MDAPANHPTTKFNDQLRSFEQNLDKYKAELDAPPTQSAQGWLGRTIHAVKSTGSNLITKATIGSFNLNLGIIRSTIKKSYDRGELSFNQFASLDSDVNRISKKIERISNKFYGIEEETKKTYDELSAEKISNTEIDQSVALGEFYNEALFKYLLHLRSKCDPSNAIRTPYFERLHILAAFVEINCIALSKQQKLQLQDQIFCSIIHYIANDHVLKTKHNIKKGEEIPLRQAREIGKTDYSNHIISDDSAAQTHNEIITVLEAKFRETHPAFLDVLLSDLEAFFKKKDTTPQLSAQKDVIPSVAVKQDNVSEVSLHSSNEEDVLYLAQARNRNHEFLETFIYEDTHPVINYNRDVDTESNSSEISDDEGSDHTVAFDPSEIPRRAPYIAPQVAAPPALNFHVQIAPNNDDTDSSVEDSSEESDSDRVDPRG